MSSETEYWKYETREFNTTNRNLVPNAIHSYICFFRKKFYCFAFFFSPNGGQIGGFGVDHQRWALMMVPTNVIHWKTVIVTNECKQVLMWSNHVVISDTEESLKKVRYILNMWRCRNTAWLLEYTGPLHIVHYDDLKTGLVDELTAVLRFLDAEVTSQQMDCVVKQTEGQFHRKPRPVPIVFTRKILKLMDEAVKEIDQCIEKRQRAGLYLSW